MYKIERVSGVYLIQVRNILYKYLFIFDLLIKNFYRKLNPEGPIKIPG
jgi:hypothetical protein